MLRNSAMPGSHHHHDLAEFVRSYPSPPLDCKFSSKNVELRDESESAPRVRCPAAVECARHDAATRCGVAATGLKRRSDDGRANGGSGSSHRRGSEPRAVSILHAALGTHGAL